MWIGKTDIYATAVARVQPLGGSKTIQPLTGGRVKAIHVSNGVRVKAGQLLLELDPTEIAADVAALSGQIMVLDAEIARRELAIAATERRNLDVEGEPNLAPGIDEESRAREQAILLAEIYTLRSALNAADARVAEVTAQRRAQEVRLVAQERVVDSVRARAEMHETLRDRKLGSEASVLAVREELAAEMAETAEYRGNIEQLSAAIVALNTEKEGLVAAFVADNAQALAVAYERRQELAQDLVKADSNANARSLSAPVEGTVQDLAVTTLNQVVAGGESLMTIVPTDAPLEVEALVASSQIGFIREDQRAIVKIDAFPYIKYGTLEGTVVRVSRDANRGSTPASAASAITSLSQGGGAAANSAFYTVTILLDQDSVAVGSGRIALVAGMTGIADIRTDERRILEWLVSPLLRVIHEAAHEP